MSEFMENDQYPQGHDERDDGYKESHGNFRYRSDLSGLEWYGPGTDGGEEKGIC
jgi:hypothetical protein